MAIVLIRLWEDVLGRQCRVSAAEGDRRLRIKMSKLFVLRPLGQVFSVADDANAPRSGALTIVNNTFVYSPGAYSTSAVTYRW